MAPKPITFNDRCGQGLATLSCPLRSLQAAKGDLKPIARQTDATKTAAANDQQASNGRARKSIVERIAANHATHNSATPLTPATGVKSRSVDKPKLPAAGSPSAKTDTSNLSHQPRENQPWINKMKRPSSDGAQPHDSIHNAEDRKRQKPDQYQSMAGMGSRAVPTQKARGPQGESVKPQGDILRTGASQFVGSGRGTRQTSVREDSAMHVLESGVRVTRSQPQSNSFPKRSRQGPDGRPGHITDAVGTAMIGSMAWHTVVEQLREQAVQETDRALADASDHIRALLVEKINKLADVCGFVAKVSKGQSGDIVATFKHASTLNTAAQHLPLEVPDSPSAACDTGQSPRVLSELDEAAATVSHQHSPSPRTGPIVERIEQDHPRQDKRAAVPLSARIEHGNEAPMSFHRLGERETPPLPASGREDSPDDIEEVKHQAGGAAVAGVGMRAQNPQGVAHRDRVRLPSPPRGGRHLPMHAPAGRRRDDRGPPFGVRIMPDAYSSEMGPPRGPMGGRGWVRDSGRRGGRVHDHRGGYHHDQMRRNQRR